MLTTFWNTAPITLDIQARRWRMTSPAGRRFSDMELWIPDGSPALDPAYIRGKGGSYVRVDDHYLGTFEGITQPVEDAAGGKVVRVYHLGWWLTRRVVARQRTFTALSAGAIMRQAIIDAHAGLGHTVLRLGTFVEAAPVIPSYEFHGQYAADVAGDLQDLTGSEWNVTNGAFNWTPPVSAVYDTHLCDGGELSDARWQGSIDDQIAELIGRDSWGREYRAVDAVTFGDSWDARQVVTDFDTTSQAVLAISTEALLAAQRHPSLTFTAGLLAQSPYLVTGTGSSGHEVARLLGMPVTAVKHWSTIREGTVLLLHLPRAELRGMSPAVKVLSREYVEGAKFLTLELQYLPPITSAAAMRLEAFRAVPQFTPRTEHNPIRQLMKQRAAIRDLQTA